MVSEPDTLEMEPFARASRRAGLLTAVGAAMVLCTLGYSAWKLAVLDKEVRQRRVRIEKLKGEQNVLSASTTKLADEIRNLREQAASLAREGDALFSGTAPRLALLEGGEPRKELAAATVDLARVVKPRASAERQGHLRTPDGKPIYLFSAWLDVPEERKGEIVEVGYGFDHPTFRRQHQESRDAANGYRVSYKGWGCLRRVTVTLTLRDGTAVPMEFDMCAAVGW